MRTIGAYTITFTIIFLFLVGCTNKKAEKCPIEELILDENSFPQGTHAEQLYSTSPDDSTYSADRSFYYAPDLAFQEVIRWNSVLEAKRYFNSRAKSVFDIDKYMGPWITPPELDYTSSIADKYRVACGIAHSVYQCRMIATYDQYFLFFRSYVTEQGISLSTFDRLLMAIDTKMVQCLGE